MALSEICQYAIECIRALDAAIDRSGKGTTTHLSIPQLPSFVTEIVRDCVRFSERSQAKQLADLIAELQIQRARFETLISDRPHMVVTNHAVQMCMWDAAGLHASAEQLFPFGRRSEEGERSRAPKEETIKALRIADIDEHDHAELFKLIAARDRRPGEPAP